MARRQQIFRAVGPSIGAQGICALSMDRAARVAGCSVGGMYHYFATKSALLRYGLAKENLHRVCDEFDRRHAALAVSDPDALLSVALSEFVATGQTYLRPSLAAVREMEPSSAPGQLISAVTTLCGRLIQIIIAANPALDRHSAIMLESALRRMWADGLAADDITPLELRRQLRALICDAAAAAAASPQPPLPEPATASV